MGSQRALSKLDSLGMRDAQDRPMWGESHTGESQKTGPGVTDI